MNSATRNWFHSFRCAVIRIRKRSLSLGVEMVGLPEMWPNIRWSTKFIRSRSMLRSSRCLASICHSWRVDLNRPRCVWPLEMDLSIWKSEVVNSMWSLRIVAIRLVQQRHYFGLVLLNVNLFHHYLMWFIRQESYFALMKRALKPNGIVCSQAGTIWTNIEHVRETLDHCRAQFPVTGYASTSVPSYPCGQIGFVIGSSDPSSILSSPKVEFTDMEIDSMSLRYYTSAVHRAAFVLPRFAQMKLFK